METLKRLYEGFKDDAIFIILIWLLISLKNPLTFSLIVYTLISWVVVEYFNNKYRFIEKIVDKVRRKIKKK